MNIRKEQALFVVVLLLAAYIWSGMESARMTTRISPQKKDYDAPAVPTVTLASVEDRVRTPGRDLFRVPSESSPLAPRGLPFPGLQPVPFVAPPLNPGPQPGHFQPLRVDGGAVAQHTFAGLADEDGDEDNDEDNGSDAGNDAGNDQDGGNQDFGGASGVALQDPTSLSAEELNQRFDRIWYGSGASEWYGKVIHKDPLSLEGTGPFTSDIVFEFYSQKTGRSTGAPRTIKYDEVRKITLADNLENRVGRRKREFDESEASVQKRIELIIDMLDWARDENWVYADAEQQARKIIEIQKGGETGYLWLVRTLRAQGAFDREYELYSKPTRDFEQQAYRWRMQGEFEARLSLWADAEKHLRQAVAERPNGPRELAALGQFLLARGGSNEALPLAQKAVRNIAQISGQSEAPSRNQIHGLLVDVNLALGDITAAQNAMTPMGTSAAKNLARGAVAYASGDVAGAKEQFRRISEESADPEPVYGMACCALRSGDWDEAMAQLDRVIQEAPAMRHAALAAKGLLFERTGNGERALRTLEDARLANPKDAYVLYLLGRNQRLQGRYDEAVTTLREALALRDDFVEAMAEAGRALLQKSQRSPVDAADLLASAVRYARRVVELDQGSKHYTQFLEEYGYMLYLLGDLVEAREVLKQGSDQGSAFCQLGLSILDYRQKRGTQARDTLTGIAGDVATSKETRDHARMLVGLIDDHASKEQVRDSFDRELIGSLWQAEGRLSPILRDGGVTFRGESGTVGQESLIQKAVPAKNHLRSEVTMTLPGDVGTTQFAGLRVALEGAGSNPFRIDLGMRARRPELWFSDGRPKDGEEPREILSQLGTIDFSQPQRLAVEFVPTTAQGGRAFGLKIYWNDVLVKEVERLRAVSATKASPLLIQLVAQGRPVNALFTDFRLVRRRAE